jgi:hypothetical protein
VACKGFLRAVWLLLNAEHSDSWQWFSANLLLLLLAQRQQQTVLVWLKAELF